MPHIVYICSRFITGGTEKYILNKAEWLVRNKGYKVSIISSGGEYESQIPSFIKHYKVQGIDEPPFIHRRKTRKQIYLEINRIVSQLNADIVETYEVYPVFYVFKAVRNVPVILNLLTEVGYHKNPIFRILTQFYSVKDLFFVLTNSSIEIINQTFLFKIKKYKVIPIPLEIKAELITSHKNYILSVARMSYDKMYVKSLISDFSKFILETQSSLDLVLVGDGELFSEVEKIVFLQNDFCQKRIHLIGKKYNDELQDLFKNCKIFVGMGTSLLNAAAYGKISIMATNDPKYQEFGIGIFGEHEDNDSFGQMNNFSKIHSFEYYLNYIENIDFQYNDIKEKSIEIINKRYNKEIINSNWHNEYSNTIKSHSSNSILGCFMYIVFDFVVTLILNTHIFWRRLKNKNYTD